MKNNFSVIIVIVFIINIISCTPIHRYNHRMNQLNKEKNNLAGHAYNSRHSWIRE